MSNAPNDIVLMEFNLQFHAKGDGDKKNAAQNRAAFFLWLIIFSTQ